MDSPVWPMIWLACGALTLGAAVFAGRSRAARDVGRASVAALFLVGGALVHSINLVSGADYADFADPAWFAWVTDAWRAVVPPHVWYFIGLLTVFEATVGVLALVGGRWTQVAYVLVIAFYSALWLFGWMEAAWCLVMVPPMLLLLRAEHRAENRADRATGVVTSRPAVEQTSAKAA